MKINKQARVVITGLGVVSPNAIGVNAFEKAIKEGRSGIRFFPELKNLNFRCQVGGIPELSESDINRFKQKYNVEDILSTGILYGCIAGVEAWQNAGLWNVEDARISGCIFGTGSNGAEATELQRDNFLNGHPGKISPKVPIQSLANAVSIYLNKIIGFNGLVTTNSAACNTGAEGILMGYDYISNGLADRILIGGSESSSFFVWSPFDAMFATAQNYNDCPQEASKPLSMHAAGFVPSAGAGAFVLESLDSALSRGAYIYCEVLGGHLNSGGQRNKGSMTLGNKEGMVRCIRAAVQESGIQPNDIGLISGHLTSTIGDVAEIESWYEALELGKNNIPYINSLKSMIGHSLSASGSIEIIATVLQLIKGFIHPSLNAFPLHSEIAKYIEEKHVPQVAIDAPELKVAAKISLGFGDVNGCAILKKWEGGE